VDPDASKYAVGCVVSQLVDGVEQPIGFYSTALEKNFWLEQITNSW